MKPARKDDDTRVFRALAVDSRLEIVRLLAGRPLCVGALTGRMDISTGAVSQHLRVLREAGLVEATRIGPFMHYRLAPGAGDLVRAAVRNVFDQADRSGRRKARRKGGSTCAADKANARSRRS